MIVALMPEQEADMTRFDQLLKFEVAHEAIGIEIARRVLADGALNADRPEIAELQRIQASLNPNSPDTFLLARTILTDKYSAQKATAPRPESTQQ
jgi:hypothetical protein